MAGKINKNKIKQSILNDRNVRKVIEDEVNKIVQKEKSILISNFESHPVTQEIEGGSSAGNISGTLGGYGNLFSFLGFEQGSKPVATVRALLNTISLGRVYKQGDGFIAQIIVPSKDELIAVSKLPWEFGRSWLFDVEKSISGLGFYLYGRFRQSRSGTGIQTSNQVFPRGFSPVKYFNGMYNRFIKNLGGRIK
jgi:hypothetical protein